MARDPGDRDRVRPSRRVLLAGAVAGLATGSRNALAQTGPLVAAAASWRPALDGISNDYEAKTGVRVRVSYGATGNLVRQIEGGAPFELFLAADEESVVRLAGGGLTDGPGRPLANGTLVVAALRSSGVRLDPELAGLGAVVRGGHVRHIAIANPELAPYGRAAREALARAGLADVAMPRLIFGENVGQAAQFVAAGAAEVGFIALSAALSAELRDVLRFAPVREDWYRPIAQHMAVLKRAGPAARDFARFLTAPEARAAFERAGFKVP